MPRSNSAIDIGTAHIRLIRNGKIILNEPRGSSNNHQYAMQSTDNGVPLLRESNSWEEMLKEAKELICPILESEHNLLVSVSLYSVLSKLVLIAHTFQPFCLPNPVTFIYEPIAAAIGVGINVFRKEANMIVNVGAERTEIAVIKFGYIVFHRTIKVAGNDFTKAILRFIKDEHNLLVNFQDAEDIKLIAGSVFKMDDEFERGEVECIGKNLLSGIPSSVNVSHIELRESVLCYAVREIVMEVRWMLKEYPPEISKDIFLNGIWLTGGSARLKGLAARLQHELSIQVNVPEDTDPFLSTILGAGKVVNNIDKYQRMLIRR